MSYCHQILNIDGTVSIRNHAKVQSNIGTANEHEKANSSKCRNRRYLNSVIQYCEQLRNELGIVQGDVSVKVGIENIVFSMFCFFGLGKMNRMGAIGEKKTWIISTCSRQHLWGLATKNAKNLSRTDCGWLGLSHAVSESKVLIGGNGIRKVDTRIEAEAASKCSCRKERRNHLCSTGCRKRRLIQLKNA
jgi:hypothetical protein